MLGMSLTLCNELNVACEALMTYSRLPYVRLTCRHATRICDPDYIESNHLRQRNMDIICDISKLCWGASELGLVSVDASDMSEGEKWRAMQRVCEEQHCNKP